MDYYIKTMLKQLVEINTMMGVEIAPAVAAGFVGSTGYIDQIELADFISREADVLYGKDNHGRIFISIMVVKTAIRASTLMAIRRGETLDESAENDLAWAAKPRVLTLFQRFQNRDDVFVTAGDVSLGSPQDCPQQFYAILGGVGRYEHLTLKDVGATPVAVPEHKPLKVDGYHIDGSVGVINL